MYCHKLHGICATSVSNWSCFNQAEEGRRAFSRLVGREVVRSGQLGQEEELVAAVRDRDRLLDRQAGQLEAARNRIVILKAELRNISLLLYCTA